MDAYGIGIIVLIKKLKGEFPDIIQPWYAGYDGALGTFKNVELYLDYDYYTKLSKHVLIVHPENIEPGKFLSCVMGLNCAQACATLVDLSWTTIPNVIG